MNTKNAPVITIDGPSGSGKGTLARALSKRLTWHLLDSGVIYRAIAWAVGNADIAFDKDLVALELFLKQLDISIVSSKPGGPTCVLCNNEDITGAIRTISCSTEASNLSALPIVRDAVLQYQRNFRRAPGLVTDGRDMGTVVFPNASLKFYLDANIDARAERRFQQLQTSRINVSLGEVRQELSARDYQDQNRAVAPAKVPNDAFLIDTTSLSVNQVANRAMDLVKAHDLL